MAPQEREDTFKAFLDSFFYKDRADLNFKFLAHLPPAVAADFFQKMLVEVGRAFDHGRWDALLAVVLKWQQIGYDEQKHFAYDDGPFEPLSVPVSSARVALLTSSGHFVRGDDPAPFGVTDMGQEEAMQRIQEFLKAEPVLSAIPVDTPAGELKVRHGGYDISGAVVDPDVAFPYRQLKAMAADGRLGGLHDTAYSFVGACAQKRLLEKELPQWVSMLKDARIDGAILVPL